MHYEYLEKFRTTPAEDANGNSFYKVKSEDILQLSKETGFKTPKSLDFFWKNIGYGFLNMGYDGVPHIDYTNQILSPLAILALSCERAREPWVREDVIQIWEELTPEFFPFFEIADSANFLMMKKDEPDNSAVYDMGGTLIEAKFENFIHNLYYKSPVYYLDKLED